MIIDGKQISQSLKDAMKIEVEALEAQYGRRPCLMVIIVGNNPASRSYVTGKIKATEYCGFDGHLVELPEDVSEATLLAEIDKLNNDNQVDGILVQLPLPKHISEDKVIAAISAEKDVDGFHPNGGLKLRQMHDWFSAKRRIEIAPNARFIAKIFAYIKDFQYLCSKI